MNFRVEQWFEFKNKSFDGRKINVERKVRTIDIYFRRWDKSTWELNSLNSNELFEAFWKKRAVRNLSQKNDKKIAIDYRSIWAANQSI